MNFGITLVERKTKRRKSAAANWRFGATAAVTPQKRQCENERLSPA